ncbi:BatD family protein [Tahibacter harae]|uniref:BatD family protein n=1 Tax=Tahibacter harae TaxID=2963937 RepID=A0ABT1QR69_9GAMM|nr:BatD family protein [Tahibacter harae]MCQ4164768.1 BatD family protein [Tahibacter harae]
MTRRLFSSLALLLVLCLLLPATAFAAAAPTARAWLDRDSMQLGETVTLNIETTESAAEPDFSVLETDFELLNRSSSTSVSIVNGDATSTRLWAIGLKPRREGRLTIPEFPVGNGKTAAVQLEVGAAPVVASAKPGDDLFIEVTADPLNVFVQQQIRVTVKLFFAVNLTDGGLDELAAGNAVVQKLGQDRAYDTERSGRRYRVLERRYAVTAEKSGLLELPAVQFRGRALSGNDPNAMFFGRGRAVSTRSDAISIDVRPRPAEAGNGPWLPAQSLELRAEGITEPASGRVGEPLTLTLTVVAQGLGFEQLPELELPAIDGADVYPDKSVTRSRESGGWIVGERSRKFAIVPKRPGSLRIPGASLGWWNTTDNQAATAQSPSFTVDVAPAAAASAEVPAVSAPAVVTAAPAAAADGAQTVFWRNLALSSFALWLASALLLFWYTFWRRRGARPIAAAVPAPAGQRRDFDQAVSRGDAHAAARTLLAWARREGFAAVNLGELARQLDSAAQQRAIDQLQAALYAAGAGAVLPADLAAAFRDGLHRRAAPAAANEDSVLAPLWPGAERH